VNIDHIIQAWRDAEYAESLTEAERALLPASPVSEIDLTDVELADIDAGTTGPPCVSATISVISATVTWFTASYCVSIAGGGTCQQGTSGCC